MPINKLQNGPYAGAYTIETSKTADLDFLSGLPLDVSENIISVPAGMIKQVMGGIQFYAQSRPFHLKYSSIRTIKSSTGEIMWENWNKEE